jgi:ABC-2 type transport system ATP-binding protein
MSVPDTRGGGAPSGARGTLDPAGGSVLVAVDGLTRRFGDFTAVDHVSFEVRAGEIFGFLGPNGAGKTTTIKMLTGLLSPTEGEGQVAGLDIRTEHAAIKNRIGYMSQKFSLYGDLTVGENIELFAGLYGVDGERLERRRRWILGMAELEEAEGRLTDELPLGWKQRLALGCALVHEPPILFLDEPTSGVDPLARRRFWDLIDELSRQGTTVFVSTHYMEEAEYCHRLALMNRGRLIALDAPRALRTRVVEPILEVRTDATPEAVTALSGRSGIVDVGMFGRALHVTVEDADAGAERIREILGAAGRTVRGIHPVEASLEDVFVSLVRAEGGQVEG